MSGIPDLGYKVPIEDNRDTRICWDESECVFDIDGTPMSCDECPYRPEAE